MIVPGVAFFLGVTGIQNTMVVLAWAVIALFPICIIIPIMTVADNASSHATNRDWKRGLRIIWHNGPFKRLLFAFAIQGMGRQFVAILFVLYTIHVIKAPDAPPLVLAGYFGAGIIGIPLWGIADKLSMAVAAFLALWILTAFGFDPKIDNGPGALLALSVCYLLLPSLFSIGAAILIWNYPITSERHQRLRDRLQRRREQKQVAAAVTASANRQD